MSRESWKTQEDAPQLESFVMVPACSQIIGETSSASTGYFACVSSECELVFSDEDGKEDAKDTEEELESPTKKIQMEEMTSPEKIRTFTPAQVTTTELLTDSESNLDIQAKDERERAESPPEPRALEECSRAKTPEWLAALDSGFQCMSCYRIFPSLEDLQKHMEHGIIPVNTTASRKQHPEFWNKCYQLLRKC
ncbi:hypothetical protein R6Z07F_006860 [Ovis aries]